MLAARSPFALFEVLLAEYRVVLVRPRLRKLHGLGLEALEPFLVEIVRHAQYPPTYGPLGKDLVDEVGRALYHASRAAARVEPASLAAEGEGALGAAAVAGDAQEPVLESPADEEALEPACNVAGQGPALGGGPSLEAG